MFTLPKLPYAFDALMPYIDAKTMEIHLTKHHQAYVDNLNQALQPYSELKNYSLEDLLKKLKTLPEPIRTAVQNNAGGHFNHSLFWLWMTPKSKIVQGSLYQQIAKQFTSMQAFQDRVNAAAKARFGSGWAWLFLNSKGNLQVYSTANQDAVLMNNDVPLLGLDVWEHAYYLQYQNRRPDYIAAWWSVVNWEFVEERYLEIIGK